MVGASDVIWGGLFAVGTAVEVWALSNGKPGDTLSERVRSWFRVDTVPGKVVFSTAWVGFAAWFLVHIVF